MRGNLDRCSLKSSVACLFALAAMPAQADPIDDFVRAEMKRQRIPGVAIAIVRDGKITKTKGYGFASLDHEVPVTPDTVFALASITKQFTATLIMLLVEEGKVNLDDEISKYLADTPEAWKGITVRHLLNHTSGLSQLGQDFVSMVRTLNITTDKMYEAARRDPIGGKPGERWSYSDVGYFLLGMIIERASGKTYEAFLRQRILDPVGMTTARMLDQNRPYKNLARGYTLVRAGDDWEVRNIRRDLQMELTPHYGLFGSVKDLAKWDAALARDAVLKPASFRQMLTPTTLASGEKRQYGFGWGLGERQGIETHYHSGITGTFILRVPSLRLCVIVLTNLGAWAGGRSRGADPYMIAHAIAGLAEPKFQWKPLADQDAALAAKAREAFESLRAGKTPGSQFGPAAVEDLAPDLKALPTWYADFGKVRRVELVERAVEEGETVGVFRVTFERGSRVFAFIFAKDGKVSGFFPDG